MNEEKRLGNLYGGSGGNWAGMVYAACGLAPAILTAQGGGRQPHIVVREARSRTRRGRVTAAGQICPTLTAQNNEVYRIMGNSNYTYRIRKLTPKECWRLMGWSDEDFHKAEAVNSNTQLYKQAGNGIVVPELEAIFAQMLKGGTK